MIPSIENVSNLLAICADDRPKSVVIASGISCSKALVLILMRTGESENAPVETRTLRTRRESRIGNGKGQEIEEHIHTIYAAWKVYNLIKDRASEPGSDVQESHKESKPCQVQVSHIWTLQVKYRDCVAARYSINLFLRLTARSKRTAKKDLFKFEGLIFGSIHRFEMWKGEMFWALAVSIGGGQRFVLGSAEVVLAIMANFLVEMIEGGQKIVKYP
jgi:hypothetical protein